jgi:hypothetical protein
MSPPQEPPKAELTTDQVDQFGLPPGSRTTTPWSWRSGPEPRRAWRDPFGLPEAAEEA